MIMKATPPGEPGRGREIRSGNLKINSPESARKDFISLIADMDKRAREKYSKITWDSNNAEYENGVLSFNMNLDNGTYNISIEVSPETSLTNDYRGELNVSKLNSKDPAFRLNFNDESVRGSEPYAHLIALVDYVKKSLLVND